MSKQKPALPQGTRDFGPDVMVKRNYILDTIKKIFQKYAFLPLETPALERLDVLTGKYGEEGDQLIFKILNSGDYLRDVGNEDLADGYKKFTPKIAEKALRYDLTVPFARFVVMNQGQITFPFRRYQVQPVWRGDRPQKGRYREFYQCDADVVGTDSLICEAEIVLMINEALSNLGIRDFSVKINNRKILAGIAEAVGENNREGDLCTAIDKLDKIGEEKVLEELKERGFGERALEKIKPVFFAKKEGKDTMEFLQDFLQNSETGLTGLEEIRKVFILLRNFTGKKDPALELKLDFDITLARGLSYYTGAIFEVKANNVQIGSICGGGRYDNLTGTFGLPGLSGVGISFGIDRIYDVMESLDLFTGQTLKSTQVMFVNFGEDTQNYCLSLLYRFRQSGISSEIYPSQSRLDKQLRYANAKNIPFVVIAGEEEIGSGLLTLKNMKTGEQQKLNEQEILDLLKG